MEVVVLLSLYLAVLDDQSNEEQFIDVLGSTEKYLTAVQLVEKMSEQEKDRMYRYIIEMMLIDNSSKCRTKKPPENKVQNT